MIRGDFREDIGVCAWMCVCVCVQRGEMITPNMSLRAHTDTHTRNIALLYAWYVIHVLFNRRHSYRTGQDIENCGTCRDCACIIYRYVRKGCCAPVSFLHIFITRFTREHWERSACLVAQLCASRCHFHSRQSGEFSFCFFYGLVGLAFCSVWQAQPDCSTLGRATRRTNTAAGLIAERSDESFIKTYHTHTLSCCSLSGLMRWTTTQT